jgi:diacylglycerol kinase family enzyme
MLSNTRSYGGVIRIASNALVDDGLLDAYIFEARNPLRLATTATRLARHRFEGSPDITEARIRELEVLTPGLRVQIDGEYIGETPVRFTVAPAALDILLPPAAAPSLFGSPAVINQRPAISN